MLFIFAALSAGSYGGGSTSGLFAALTAWRFLLGLAIGSEYPAGSVAAAESSGELKAGTRHRWFIFATDCAIDFGFVIAAFVPMVVVLATTEDHLRVAWRIMLGLGVIPPLSLLYLRLKLKEPEAYVQTAMKNTPVWLTIKFYWFRLLTCGLIWFIYNFSAYGFGIYSSAILDNLLGNDNRLWVTFGWNTVLNLWYMPGCIFGVWVSDWIGPRYALTLGVTLQAIVGFIMAGCYKYLNEPSRVGGFVVVYGIFLALGEVGPGDNIGLISSKTSATPVRGRYYATAAALGKVGAFVGTYLFPIIQDNAPTPLRAGQDPFWVVSSLAIFSGMVAFFCLPISRKIPLMPRTEDLRHTYRSMVVPEKH
ncbi:hypothetical protein H072_8397 [Dactylellina haptotyla CBS 200.50]|uniref:Major facilitator superfamily (MFS) profile domain-containing protein n=1 Tax=Dactylellina haptotyla (strain CBS 200.50) TaxID=1284197 RepID=S8A520_DACHA|nr:hypothetical protein H072_8397 [Dactylellina haptotyla CBS 200.50]